MIAPGTLVPTPMKKLDLKKAQKHLYAPSAREAVVVEVPPANFIMVDGRGDPNTSREYAEAVEALFTVAYALKYAVKKSSLAVDYTVMPLEGLWWTDDMATFSVANKAAWKWTMMIRQPELITRSIVQAVVVEVKRKKSLPGVARLRFVEFNEGWCTQILHIGPFSEEGPAVEKIHHLIAAQGRQRSGKHHEIYLTDIRRADPKNWKTIVRQPFRLT